MKAAVKRTGLTVVFIVLVVSLYYLPLASWVSALVEWGQQHPIAGPLAYVFFVVVATVLFLPGSVAMMIGGFLFGFLPGFLYAVIAIPVGAQGAFEFGRWVAQPWVRRKVADSRRMHAIEAALREEAFVIVVLTRLSLIIPFNLLARDLGQILSGEAAPPELGYWIIGAGIAAIVAATWVIQRTATRALEKHLNEQESKG